MHQPVALALPFALPLALLLAAAPVAAQGEIPDKFTNLQVLPKGISKDDLVATMRDISGALGVRCDYCHERPQGAQSMDFASDKKEPKQIARTMIRMVTAINSDYLGRLPVDEGKPPSASCFTCHHGSSTPPSPLEDVLFDTATSKGVTAAVNQYKSMRSRLGEAGQYDFRETTLLRLGNRLREQKRPDDALAVYRAASEVFPASANAQAGIGQVCLEKGDLAGAEAAFRRALELEPGNRGAAQGLKAVEAKRIK
jgi:tetratricopeptide (TPR) repeat protein